MSDLRQHMELLLTKLHKLAPQVAEARQKKQKTYLDLAILTSEVLMQGVAILEVMADELGKIRVHLEGTPTSEEYRVSKSQSPEDEVTS